MPIKRHPSMQQLSREHHHGLVLCWKIRQGFAKGVSPERMKAYVDWFYKNHLASHFEMEEKHVFPVLGPDHKLIQKALDDHQLLTRLFNDPANPGEFLKQIEVELEKHIRFEERTLFDEIEKAATPAQLAIIKEVHREEKFVDNLSDPFWN